MALVAVSSFPNLSSSLLFAENRPPAGIDASAGSAATRSRLVEAYGRLPLHFEENRGQADSRVRFLSRGPGYAMFLTPGEMVLDLRPPRGAGHTRPPIRMELAGAEKSSRIVGTDELPGRSNYFVGNDPFRWTTGVPHFARVRYEGVYPGIDLVYYGNPRELEYDFVVAPGGSPDRIRLRFSGAGLSLDPAGALRLSVSGAEVVQKRPVIYQERDGVREAVAGGYVPTGPHEVGFRVARYDRARPLWIDPVLVYSTYLGGAGDDEAFAVAVDSAGSAYVAGQTRSANFPLQAPFKSVNASGATDGFVTKFNAAGTALVYSTYLGGSTNQDFGLAIAVDGAGNAYVAGETSSTDFPTVNPIQATNGGGVDGFVTKLNAAGSALLYSTYIGGNGNDEIFGIAVDPSGNACVSGSTISTNFPTVNPFQGSFGGGSFFDAFAAKINAAGSALVYSTYLGGNGGDFARAVATDSLGNAYIVGAASTGFPTLNAFQATSGGGSGFGFEDAFLTKLDPSGTALFSTFLGGNGTDNAFGVSVDGSASVYVAGITRSTNFPTVNPFQATYLGAVNDGFVTKFNPAGSALIYSTYFGNSTDVRAIATDAAGNAFLAGQTSSVLPQVNPVQAAFGGGASDAFVSELNPAGSALVYSTFLGGSANDVGFGLAVDSSGAAYVVGLTDSLNWPTQTPFQATHGGGSDDAFAAKLSGSGVLPTPTPTTTPAVVTVTPTSSGPIATATPTAPLPTATATPAGIIPTPGPGGGPASAVPMLSPRVLALFALALMAAAVLVLRKT